MPYAHALTLDEANRHLSEMGQEFAVIENVGLLFPAKEIVSLAPCHTHPEGPLRAVFMDMDGTTTLTEDLCVHSLTLAIRELTATAEGIPAVPHLDHEQDFPHIIGTSASTNVAYLLDTYGTAINPEAMNRAFIYAAAWNLNEQRNPLRRLEAEATLRACGGEALLEDPSFLELVSHADSEPLQREALRESMVDVLANQVKVSTPEQTARVVLDVYYKHLHGYFTAIGNGDGARVALEVYGDASRPAIAPLPGVGLACALAKGLLAEFPEVAVSLAEAAAGRSATEKERDALARASEIFGRRPAKVALVTSSGLFEASVVLKEVFRGLRMEVLHWPLPEIVRDQLTQAFATPEGFYDTLITADESHEIRLKPYRDLYTIAARNLGLDQIALRNSVGFEDTWAGIMAQRGAGVGIPCAVPFEGSKSHDFSLASHVFHNGIPEAILGHALFCGADIL